MSQPREPRSTSAPLRDLSNVPDNVPNNQPPLTTPTDHDLLRTARGFTDDPNIPVACETEIRELEDELNASFSEEIDDHRPPPMEDSQFIEDEEGEEEAALQEAVQVAFVDDEEDELSGESTEEYTPVGNVSPERPPVTIVERPINRGRKRKRTSRGPHSKYWCFTVNDPVSIVKLMESFEGKRELDPNVAYITGQVESGEQNHTHFQGYLELKNRQRLSWLKNNLSATAHFEKRRGTQKQAIAYVHKSKTRISGPFELGTKTPETPGKRNDLLNIKKLLDNGTSVPEICQNDEFFATAARHHKFFQFYSVACCLKNRVRNGLEPLEVILLIGVPGTGKSEYCLKHYPLESTFWKVPQTKWWDGYHGQETIILDDFNSGWFPWDTMMRLLDKTPMKVEIKGGSVDLCSTRICITSNTHPRYWYRKMGAKFPALRRRITKCLLFEKIMDLDEEDAASPWKEILFQEIPDIGNEFFSEIN